MRPTEKPSRDRERAASAGASASDSPSPAVSSTALRRAQWTASISGVLGFLLFLATPFLPVVQEQSSLNWPGPSQLQSVSAPLVAYTPQTLSLEVPCSAAEALPGGRGTIVATAPQQSPHAADRTLVVSGTGDGIRIANRGETLLFAPRSALADCTTISVSSTADGVHARVNGTDLSATDPEPDNRPMVVGVFTDLPAAGTAATAGISFHAELDSRFSTSPTLIKLVAMILGLILMVVSFAALHRLDGTDGRTSLRFFPRSWFRPRLSDAAVVGILGIWHFIGGNTSDDGYTTTMARAAEHSGYMANYYRWWGVTESPFGSPFYDILHVFSWVSPASPWIRLPSLLFGLITWWLISREVIPRLGRGVRQQRVATWTAAAVFVAFWTAYNNGTRPEVFVAVMALLTWCSVERAIATRRLLPYAVAITVATLALSGNPTGLAAVATLLVGIPPVLRGIIRRRRTVGLFPQLAPLLAAGTAILVAVFSDQTLSSVLESTRARAENGPSVSWFEEVVRYQVAFSQAVDGGMPRRTALLAVIFSLALIIAALLWKRRIPGLASGPAWRLVGMQLGSIAFIMFSPTKWTHHFGAWAGIGASLAAVSAYIIWYLGRDSIRNRLALLTAVLGMASLALAGWNGWWWVSSYGIPWFDRVPQFRSIEFADVFLVLTVISALLTLVLHMRMRRGAAGTGAADTGAADTGAGGAGAGDAAGLSAPDAVATAPAPAPAETAATPRYRSSALRTVASAPFAVVVFGVVAISVLSFAKGMYSQYPAYSVGKGNVSTLRGDACMMGSEVLVESDPAAGMLAPLNPALSPAAALRGEDTTGFQAAGIPERLKSDPYYQIGVGRSASATPLTASHTDATTADGTANGTAPGAASGDQNSAAGEAGSAATPGTEATTDSGASDPGVTGGIITNEMSSGNGDGSAGGAGVTPDARSAPTLPFGLPADTPVLGSYREGVQVPSQLFSGWYSLPEASVNQPLITFTAAGPIYHTDITGKVEWGLDVFLEYGRAEADGSVRIDGAIRPYDLGPAPSWRNLRVPRDQLTPDANVVRITAFDPLLNPDLWLAVTPPRVPTLATLNEVVGTENPVLTDWPVGLQFPCQQPFRHHAGVAEVPQYRIAADRALTLPGPNTWQSYRNGGPLGWLELLTRNDIVPTYLNHDWNREWGELFRLTPYQTRQESSPVPAEISVASITRSGLWKPELELRSHE